MSQCSYQIKEKRKMFCLLHCQLEAGHAGDHRAPTSCLSRGDCSATLFEGIWHLPGEKSAADPEPYIASVPSCWASTRPPQILKQANIQLALPKERQEEDTK
jgi:hypothetical protein